MTGRTPRSDVATLRGGVIAALLGTLMALVGHGDGDRPVLAQAAATLPFCPLPGAIPEVETGPVELRAELAGARFEDFRNGPGPGIRMGIPPLDAPDTVLADLAWEVSAPIVFGLDVGADRLITSVAVGPVVTQATLVGWSAKVDERGADAGLPLNVMTLHLDNGGADYVFGFHDVTLDGVDLGSLMIDAGTSGPGHWVVTGVDFAQGFRLEGRLDLGPAPEAAAAGWLEIRVGSERCVAPDDTKGDPTDPPGTSGPDEPTPPPPGTQPPGTPRPRTPPPTVTPTPTATATATATPTATPTRAPTPSPRSTPTSAPSPGPDQPSRSPGPRDTPGPDPGGSPAPTSTPGMDAALVYGEGWGDPAGVLDLQTGRVTPFGGPTCPGPLGTGRCTAPGIWSPDGRKLVFVVTHHADGQVVGPTEVRVVTLADALAGDFTGELLFESPGWGTGPVGWTPPDERYPEGRILIITRTAFDPPPGQDALVWVRPDVPGGDPRPILLPWAPTWLISTNLSPDGTRIAASVGSAEAGGIWVMNANGSDARRLVQAAPAGSCPGGRTTANGTLLYQLAWLTDDQLMFDMTVCDPDERATIATLDLSQPGPPIERRFEGLDVGNLVPFAGAQGRIRDDRIGWLGPRSVGGARSVGWWEIGTGRLHELALDTPYVIGSMGPFRPLPCVQRTATRPKDLGEHVWLTGCFEERPDEWRSVGPVRLNGIDIEPLDEEGSIIIDRVTKRLTSTGDVRIPLRGEGLRSRGELPITSGQIDLDLSKPDVPIPLVGGLRVLSLVLTDSTGSLRVGIEGTLHLNSTVPDPGSATLEVQAGFAFSSSSPLVPEIIRSVVDNNTLADLQVHWLDDRGLTWVKGTVADMYIRSPHVKVPRTASVYLTQLGFVWEPNDARDRFTFQGTATLNQVPHWPGAETWKPLGFEFGKAYGLLADNPAFTATGSIVDGGLQQFGIVSGTLNQPLGRGVFLQKLGLTLQVAPDPLRPEAGTAGGTGIAGVSFGPSLRSHTLAEADVTARLAWGSGCRGTPADVRWEFSGVIRLLGFMRAADGWACNDGAETQFKGRFSPYLVTVATRGSLPGLAFAAAGLMGLQDFQAEGIASEESFQVKGTAELRPPWGGASLRGDVLVDDAGLQACVAASVGRQRPSYGFRYGWEDAWPQPMVPCNVGSLEVVPRRPGIAPVASLVAVDDPGWWLVEVTDPTEVLVLVAQGRAGSPAIVVHRPDGSRLSVPERVEGLRQDGNAAAFAWEPARWTYLTLADPAPGRYLIEGDAIEVVLSATASGR